MSGPRCSSCSRQSRLTRGTEIYPHRKDLADKKFWKCDGCGGYVGCHPGSSKALGTPAGPDLRRARMLLHNDMLDPLWQKAPDRNPSRSQVYQYLAHHMGLTLQQTHTGMFNLVQCRDAWTCLKGLSYLDIRRWVEKDAPTRQDHVKKGQAA